MAIEHYEVEIARLQRQLDDKEIQLRQVKRDLEKSEITWRMREAGRSAGVAESALDDVVARALHSGEWGFDTRGRLRRMVHGGPDVEADGSFVSPEKWVTTQRPHAPHWFPDGPAGVPADGVPSRQRTGAVGVGKNPWIKEHWNMTEQGKIFRQSPELAQRLAAEACVELPIDTGRKR